MHLLDSSLEVARRLRKFLVGACLGGVHHHRTGIVVLILLLHLLERLLVMLVAVEVDVIPGVESLPVARSGSILLVGTSRAQQNSRDAHRHDPQSPQGALFRTTTNHLAGT